MVNSFRNNKGNKNHLLTFRNNWIVFFSLIFIQALIVMISLNEGGKLYMRGTFTFWRHDIDYKLDEIRNNIISYFTPKADKYFLNLKFLEMRKIKNAKLKAIKNNNYGNLEDSEYSKAYINFSDNKERYPLEVRLKGTHDIHFRHSSSWSFKGKTKEILPFFNNTEFSLQRPKARSGLDEYMFQKMLKNESLFSHRMKLVNLILNRQSLGNYFFIDGYSKYFVEANNRRESVIIGYDKRPLFQTIVRTPENYKEYEGKSFKIAPKESSRGSKPERFSALEIHGKDLLSKFQTGENSVSEIFHYEDFAKILAIKALFGSSEIDWRDMKFYVNPVTLKLELIGREIHTHPRTKPYDWWFIDPTKTIDDNKILISYLSKDKLFMESYLKALNKFADKNYLDKFFKEYDSDFRRITNKTKYFDNSDFNKERLYENANFISNQLRPIHQISINNAFITKNNNVKLSISNVGNFPIKILCTELNKGIRFCPKNNELFLYPKNGKSQEIFLYKNNNNSKINNLNLVLKYSTIGTNNIKSKDLLLQNKPQKLPGINYFESRNIVKNPLPNFVVNKDSKIITVKDSYTEIKQPITIPLGYKLYIDEKNAEIKFLNNSFIYVKGSISMIGKKDNPLKLYAAKESSGYLIIENKYQPSKFENVIFKGLGIPNNEFNNLRGSITAYDTNIEIKNSYFLENKSGDDYFNGVRSNVLMEGVYFNDVLADAIDLDFCSGQLNNLSFKNIGNDALDFSGSDIKVSKLLAEKIGDKGVSIGENSKVKLVDIEINNASMAIASKDSSIVKIKNSNFNSNDYNLAAYNKKPEFDGGKIFIDKYMKSDVKILKDKLSEILIDKYE